MPTTLQLDKPRTLKWAARARMRMASLDKPAEPRELGNPKKLAYALAAHVWAALTDDDAPFADPFALAPYLESTEQQIAALKAIGEILEEAYPTKKKAEPTSS